VKRPTGKILITGVASQSTEIVEHPELVAYAVIAFTELVSQRKHDAGTGCDLGGRVHPQIAWAKLRPLRDGAALASTKLRS
jgi:5-methyltetrahydropteroyltriglutamate--homocysteine methyltransferase